MTQAWQPLTMELLEAGMEREKKSDANPYKDSTKILWFNKNVKACTFVDGYGNPCAFTDEDEELITAHYLKYHATKAEVVSMFAASKVSEKQLTMFGGEITQDDLRAAIMAKLSTEQVECPFCFTTQAYRAMRFFLDGITLSKKLKCVECKREMLSGTEKWTRDPRNFGRMWYWKGVEHDEWMKAFKARFKGPDRTLFWEGYGEAHPEWLEKQRIKQMEEDYARSG